MTNEEVLNRFRTFRAVKLQPVWSYMCERRLTRPDEHVIKGGKGRASNFRRLWGGIVSLLFVSKTKTRVLRTWDDLCYHCGSFPACVCKVFNHLLVQMSFSRTSEDTSIYGQSHLKKLFLKHTARTEKMFLRPFTASPGRRCRFTYFSVGDHRQKLDQPSVILYHRKRF